MMQVAHRAVEQAGNEDRRVERRGNGQAPNAAKLVIKQAIKHVVS